MLDIHKRGKKKRFIGKFHVTVKSLISKEMFVQTEEENSTHWEVAQHNRT